VREEVREKGVEQVMERMLDVQKFRDGGVEEFQKGEESCQ